VKVIHGKGRGVLLRTVHTLLKGTLCSGFQTGQRVVRVGATIVFLKKNAEDSKQQTE